jgi:hypothetical protein
MSPTQNNDNKIDILLAVISTKLDKVIDELSEVREEMKLKVNMSDFQIVKTKIEDLEKSKWFVMGVSGAVSFFISHFWK